MTRKIVIAGMIVLLLFACIAGMVIAYIPTRAPKNPTDDAVALYYKNTGYNVDYFQEAWGDLIQFYSLTATAGHRIPVYYISPKNTYENKTIILAHWYGSNHGAMFPIAEEFLKEGWNVVLYDQRAHGKNTAKTVTFGYLESSDLRQVVDFVSSQTKGAIVGALGQSMGAATVAYYSGTEHASQYLDFAIIESSFSGMYEQINREAKRLRIPDPAKILTSLGSGFCKLMYGYSFFDVDIAQQMTTNNIPTLIIHSRNDYRCPYYMGEELFRAIPHENKAFLTYENAAHLYGFWEDKDYYAKEIFTFINDYI